MQRFVSVFTKQLQEAINIGKNTPLNDCNKTINNIVISGLGGSGIGGRIVSELVSDKLKIPLIVNSNYFLPQFADKNTLVIISSYSGDTEETVHVLNEAIKRGCEIACITSGGTVKETAVNKNLNHIIIPGGNPPRSMLTYSLVQQLFFLNHYKLINGLFLTQLTNAIALLNSLDDDIRKEAKSITNQIFEKTIAVYTNARIGGVATRFKQQINENAKELCWDHVIPEMNHNELVGWAGGNNNFAAIFLDNEDDFYRNQVRAKVSKEIIKKYTNTVITINSKGESLIEKALYLIYLTDWISVYLGNKKGVDTIEVDVITGLKNELSKL